MAYSELIKNFEKIRDYMCDFYVYGFRTRSDFNSKSSRSYDNERRRVESWLSDKNDNYPGVLMGRINFVLSIEKDNDEIKGYRQWLINQMKAQNYIACWQAEDIHFDSVN